MRTADTQNRTTTVWTHAAVALRRGCFTALATLVVLATLSTSAPESHAAIITLSPDNVNRLNQYDGTFGGGNLQNDTTSQFSTNDDTSAQGISGGPGANNQYTIVTTTPASFNAALLGVLGPLGAGQSYQINSATLAVGKSLNPANLEDEYQEANAKAHIMTTTYDVGDASWLNSDASAGGGWTGASSIAQTGGTDWESAVQASGVLATADTTTFDLTSYVQGVVGGTYSGAGEGLFFENDGTTTPGGPLLRAPTANVSWTLDAQIVVPEPSTLALLGCALGVLMMARRRSRRM